MCVFQVAKESVHSGRRLLEETMNEGNGTFQNLTEVLVFLKGVNLTVQKPSSGEKTAKLSEYLPADDNTVKVTASIENTTLL